MDLLNTLFELVKLQIELELIILINPHTNLSQSIKIERSENYKVNTT